MSGIPAWAVRGAKVVCVRDFAEADIVGDKGYRRYPVVGETYVLTEVEYVPRYDKVAVYLAGFPLDHGMDVEGFRPVTPVTLEQDVALFRSLLQPERADA